MTTDSRSLVRMRDDESLGDLFFEFLDTVVGGMSRVLNALQRKFFRSHEERLSNHLDEIVHSIEENNRLLKELKYHFVGNTHSPSCLSYSSEDFFNLEP